jgi:hypothetical protein
LIKAARASAVGVGCTAVLVDDGIVAVCSSDAKVFNGGAGVSLQAASININPMAYHRASPRMDTKFTALRPAWRCWRVCVALLLPGDASFCLTNKCFIENGLYRVSRVSI